MGEADQYFAWLTDSSRGVCTSSANATSNLKLASGYDCGIETNCLQSDGSGYYVATAADTCGEKPDHFNWMLTESKSEPAKDVTAWFKAMNDASLDWLAQSAKSEQTTAHAWTAAACPDEADAKPEQGDEGSSGGTTEAPSTDASSAQPVLPCLNIVLVTLVWASTFSC